MFKLITGMTIGAIALTPINNIIQEDTVTNSQPTPTPKKDSLSTATIAYDLYNQFKDQYKIGILTDKDLFVRSFYIDFTFMGSRINPQYSKLFSHKISLTNMNNDGLLRTYPETENNIIANRIPDQKDASIPLTLQTWGMDAQYTFSDDTTPDNYFLEYKPTKEIGGVENIKPFTNEISGLALSSKVDTYGVKIEDVFKDDYGYTKTFISEFFFNSNTGLIYGSPNATPKDNLAITTIWR